ncbi:unnamed protein product [Urochloa humidicola]
MFKINGYSGTTATPGSLPSKRLAVGGFDWEVHYTPSLVADGFNWIAFKLVLLGAPRHDNVKASLRCQLLHASSNSKARFATGFFVKGQTSHAFAVAGESFAAHKAVLASRSSVYHGRVLRDHEGESLGVC